MTVDIIKKEVSLSLSELISFSFPSGSLTRNPNFYEKPKMAAGIADSIAEDGDAYMRLYTFSARYTYDSYTFIISATPDLCAIYNNKIEAINVRAVGGKDPTPVSLYDMWLREVCISSLIAADSLKIKSLEAFLIYSFDSRIEPEKILCTYDYDSARDTLEKTLEKAYGLISIIIDKYENRLPAAKNVPFPFAKKRNGQTEFMSEVLLAHKKGEKLLLEAPTGIGKTMSALFPSIKALGHSMTDKIFYLTPKTTAQYAAQNAVNTVFSSDKGIRSIVLSAKDKMCIFSDNKTPSDTEHTPESESRSSREQSKCERCTASSDYYKRRTDALLELFSDSYTLTPEKIKEIARVHNVCPYELSLDASEYCEVIICDYNYLFDCRVYLRRYFDFVKEYSKNAKEHRNRYTFLIDEAHNLTDRARNMYSHTLKLSTFTSAITEIGNTDAENDLRSATQEIIKFISRYQKSCSENAKKDERGQLYGCCVEPSVDEKLPLLCSEFIECYEAARRTGKINFSEKITDIYFGMKDLIKKSVYFGDAFKVLCEKTNSDLFYKIVCLDPSQILSEKTDIGKTTVMFSATVSPEHYYMHTLGIENGKYVSIPSPYEKDNLSLTVFDRLSTRYTDRNITVYALCEIIHTTLSARRGNYMIFFPSYKYMEEVYRFYASLYSDADTIIQKRSMNEKERSEFVCRFDENNERTLLGFCVLGGVYAEGIDLVGEKLIGSIIVGVGMPRLSSERNMLVSYYNDKDIDGMLYSYIIPGMTRVMQAAGRVIRDETDRGVAILIDDRFSEPIYRSLFPLHWRHAKFASQPRSLSKLLYKFWEDK